MAHGRTLADAAVTHWISLSDRFLAAAEALPDDSTTMGLPRAHLLALAVEFRLKAFCHAVRGGAPESRDLTRLAGLAGACGLRLTTDQTDVVAGLNDARFTGSPGVLMDSSPPGAAATYVRELCETISAQAAEARG